MKSVSAICYTDLRELKIPQSFAESQGVNAWAVSIRLRDFEISVPTYMQLLIEIELNLNLISELEFRIKL